MTLQAITDAGPKYRALARLLDALATAIAAGQVVIDPRWRGNEEALGLHLSGEPALSAYIYTYSQPLHSYALELSYPGLDAAISSPLLEEGLELEQIIVRLRLHFDLEALT